MASLSQVKGLLVAVCENVHNGHADIAAHLMENVREELAQFSPEDIEVGFYIAETAEEAAALAMDEDCDEDDMDSGDDEDDHEVDLASEDFTVVIEEDNDAASYDHLRSVVTRMVTTGA